MLRVCVFWLMGVAAVPALAGDSVSSSKLSVLIVDGMNNHDWPRATRILKDILLRSGRFTVDVATSPAADASKEAWEKWRPAFAKYDVVLSNFNGGHKSTGIRWPTGLETAFEDYVNGGGGLVIYHSANNSFLNWPAYNRMIGLGWRDRNFGPSLVVSPDAKVVLVPKGRGRNPGHGPEHDFQITLLNTEHPITKGLPKKWMHPHDQLTHGQHGPARNMTVLTYAYSKDTGDNEPMDWVIPYGKGRVYVTTLGHLWKDKSDTAMRCIGFQTMLIRGCQWAATGGATYPIPKDFPTATEMRLRPETTLRKMEDQVTEIIHEGKTIFAISSPSGIGQAVLHRDSWPDHVILRLYLRGLERLSIRGGLMALEASVLSNGAHRRSLRVVQGDQANSVKKGSHHWTEIKAFDASGKPLKGLPEIGGYFEIALPKTLFERNPKSLTINWIDFYR